MSLEHIPAEDVHELSSSVPITHHVTGSTSPWVANDSQIAAWEKIREHRFTFFLKSRQVGLSTAVLFDDVCWLVANDAAGEVVKCGLFIDTDDKALEQKRRAMDFMDRLGIKYKSPGNNIVLPGGSMFHFATAAGKRAGSSFTFQRLHMTELPFWKKAQESYVSIMQSLTLEGECIIETTMGIDDPIAMNLYLADNQYHKVFFAFEDHLEYRCEDLDDPDFPMSHEEETWLRSEGFSNEHSMRYWLWLLRNKSGNDVNKQFREYPQLVEHAFKFAEGRWCKEDPQVLEPAESYTLPGVPGVIHIYRAAADFSHHCILGVDTGGGRGLDRSVVTVVDGSDGAICATYVSSEVKCFELAQVCKVLQDRFTYHKTRGNHIVHRVPGLRVEINGVGHGTAQEAVRLRCKVFEFDTNEGSKQQFMEITARKIEQRIAFGPEALLFEARQIRTAKGRFKGYKDLFMALGFCYAWLETNPFKPLELPRGGDTFNLKQRLKGKR